MDTACFCSLGGVRVSEMPYLQIQYPQKPNLPYPNPRYPMLEIPYHLPQKEHGTRDIPQKDMEPGTRKGPGTRDTLPTHPVKRLKDTRENITFPQLLLLAIKIIYRSEYR